MDSSVSPKDEIWFLLVCHHISNAVYPHSAEEENLCASLTTPRIKRTLTGTSTQTADFSLGAVKVGFVTNKALMG
jgi:hypothetical protein